MRKRMLIPTFAAALSALVAACEGLDDVTDVADHPATDFDLDLVSNDTTGGLIDPAGVQLARYGVTEMPCGGDQHLATVVTEENAYNAFCVDTEGRTAVFVMSRAGAEVDVNATSALEHFLTITPDEVAVPEILDDAAESKSGRELTGAIVKYVDPNAGKAIGSTASATTIGFSSTSQSSFEDNQCSKIEDWINGGDFFQTHQWCSGLLGGNAQRTASAQGVSWAREGRIRVRAYDSTVRVRRYYRNPFNGNWWNASNYTTQPGHFMVWKIFFTNAKWCQPDPPFEPICQYASDLRFRVEPSTGAKYRYTGGFVNYPPVP